MFADSLLESAPHPGHRAAWTKLVSTLLQCTALAIALTVSLFHVDVLKITPPAPSIQMISVAQPVMRTGASTLSSSTAPELTNVLVQPRFIPRTTQPGDNSSTETTFALPGAIPCTGNCGGGLSPLGNLLDHPGVRVEPPPPPFRPVRVSEMQLGDLLRKVVPIYPTIAKQIRMQGTVVLLATVGKDGRVENVQAVSGPPLLVHAAKEAVEHWQYHPYLLNHEPVVVQTQITVNFVLNRE